MPYTKVDGGYTTARGGFVRNPDQYEALRRKGMTKQRAAAISNARRKKVGKSAFGPQHEFVHVAKAAPPDTHRRHETEAAVAGTVGGGAAAANEARALNVIRQHGSSGKKLASEPWKGGAFHDRKGVSDAPAGARFSQQTHPEGVYNISSDSLIRARQRPAPRAGQNQLRESIRAHGLDRPIEMRIWENGSARITNGHHRAAIAQELGIKKVPVKVTHMPGSHPKPKSLTEGYQSLRRARYRSSLMRAANVVKGADTMISAFGVEHPLEELEKGLWSEATEHIGGFLTGARRGLGGQRSAGLTGMAKPKGVKAAAGSGFRTGRFVRRNAKPLAIGAGAGGAGVFAAKRNY